MWIVQEVCSAKALEVHWGLNSKPEHNANFVSVFKSWEQFFDQMPSKDKNAAINISQQRNGRHGEKFVLPSLMEACQESICEEPRDKVYAFLGIAHDCEDGQFPVDYSKSLFELYEDVIHFYLKLEDASETIVYFSQFVQRLFGGREAMEQDLERCLNIRLKSWLTPYNPSKIKVEAKYGMISLAGPSYDEFIALPEATKKWKIAISTWEFNGFNNKNAKSLEKLRLNNEIFMAMLYDLDHSNVSRMAIMHPLRFWDGISTLDEDEVEAEVEITVNAKRLPSTVNLDEHIAKHMHSAED